MPARQVLLAAVGFLAAFVSIAAGIYLGIKTDAPAGIDIPLSLKLLAGLPLLTVGCVLLAVASCAWPAITQKASLVSLAASAIVAALALYVAIDLATRTSGAEQTVFAFLSIVTSFAPLSTVAVAALISGNVFLGERTPRVEKWARVAGLTTVVLTGVYVVWFHENRSYDMGADWWVFLYVFAWGAGWGLALSADGSPRGRLQLGLRLGAAALVVFAFALAWEVEGGRDETWFFSVGSSRLLSLGLIVLVLSGIRLSWFGIAIGIGLALIALQQGLERADFFEEPETVLIRDAGLSMAMAVLLALISAVWAGRGRETKPSFRGSETYRHR
jgi:hypothetical protein